MQQEALQRVNGKAHKQIHPLTCGLLGLFFISAPLLADPVDQAISIDAREQQRQQERERMLQQQNNPVVDTRITPPHSAG